MLKVICPQDQRYYRSRIDLFMGMLHYSQDVPLHAVEKDMSTFIISERDPQPHSQAFFEEASFGEDEFYGGAILYKREAKNLPLAFQSLMAAPQQENVWEAITCLFSTPTSSAPTKNFLGGDQTFYKELLEKFIEFGKHAHISFLCFTLCPFEYQRTRNTGFWPYILEVKPEESPDGFFHGILPLSRVH